MSSDTQNKKQRKPLTVYEISVFSMLGAIMYCSKIILEWAPNIHLLGMFIMAFTLYYRKKALIPIYVFVMITGVLNGFNGWWIPYLYIWAILWGAVMLLPRRMPKWLPSPSRSSKRGVSVGVEMIRISRMPASIRVDRG